MTLPRVGTNEPSWTADDIADDIEAERLSAGDVRCSGCEILRPHYLTPAEIVDRDGDRAYGACCAVVES
jgi:hypothetical protein